MRNQSHTQPTLIGVVRGAVIQWRKREGWSRESVVQLIVEAHETNDGPLITEIKFDPETRDTFERSKVNADRVFRWLDDETKDKNLLPANFLPSILAALPLDLRMQCVSELLQPLGLEVCGADGAEEDEFNAMPHIVGLIKESSEAQQSLLALGPDASVAHLEAAHKETRDVVEAAKKTVRALWTAIKRRKNRHRCVGCKKPQGVPHAAGCKYDGLAA